MVKLRKNIECDIYHIWKWDISHIESYIYGNINLNLFQSKTKHYERRFRKTISGTTEKSEQT